MKYWLIIVLAWAFTACESSKECETKSESFEGEQLEYAKKVLRYRDSMDAVFYSGSNGVLPKDAISTVGKLNYFTPNNSFRIQFKFEPIIDGEVFQMKTNTDRLPEYRKYGKLWFTIQKRSLVLTL